MLGSCFKDVERSSSAGGDAAECLLQCREAAGAPGPGPRKEVGGACLEYPKASTGGEGRTHRVFFPPLRSHLPEILGH